MAGSPEGEAERKRDKLGEFLYEPLFPLEAIPSNLHNSQAAEAPYLKHGKRAD